MDAQQQATSLLGRAGMNILAMNKLQVVSDAEVDGWAAALQETRAMLALIIADLTAIDPQLGLTWGESNHLWTSTRVGSNFAAIFERADGAFIATIFVGADEPCELQSFLTLYVAQCWATTRLFRLSRLDT
jgi:hypothetical protein